MINILITIDVIVAIFLTIIILLQKSEGGALGMGSSRMGGVLTGTGAGNLLTKLTTILGIAFFVITMTLSILVSQKYKSENQSTLAQKVQIEKELKEKTVGSSDTKKIPEDDMFKGKLKDALKEIPQAPVKK